MKAEMLNYKSIIKSKQMRLWILQCLAFVPDKIMVRMQYRIKTGRRLDLKEPTRFTEKLQWYKLYYKDPKMIQCVDKYDVREFVKERGLEEILIPCIGIYEEAESIHWNELPSQFVLKDTLGAGGNDVILVPDKNDVDQDMVLSKINQWIKRKANPRQTGKTRPV